MGCGQPPVRIVQLCTQQTLFTTGATTWVPRVFSPKALRNIGPFIKSVTAYAQCADRSSNFEYKVTGAYSYDGESWTPFSGDILASQNTDGDVNSAPYTTTTDFGLYVQFVVSVQNTTGSAMENGVVSVTLSIELIS